METKGYDKIISDIREQYSYHKEEADKFFNLLKAAEQLSAPENSSAPASVNAVNTELNGKRTFESIIMEILNRENRPVPSAELRAMYKSVTNKDVVRKNFASKMSMLAKKGKIECKEMGKQNFCWGLKSVFEAIDAKELMG